MKALWMATLACVAMGCGGAGGPEADAFRRGVPGAQDVRLNVPDTAGQALEGVRRDGLQGQRAGFYVLTRAATLRVNGGTAWVLGLVKAITEHAPTSLSTDEAVWGPWSEALSPNAYRLTVKRVAPNDYTYALDARGKSEADSEFRAVLTGTHQVAVDAAGHPVEGYGAGTFTLDFDVAQTLPEHDQNVGKVDVTYARPSQQDDVRIDVEFRQVKDENSTQRIDASYRYLSTPSQGGTFDFKLLKDLDTDPARSAVETATVRSRWMANGAGRSDVKSQGGDLQAEATLSECWDPAFDSQYLAVSYYPAADYGQESSCAFPTAEFSLLAP